MKRLTACLLLPILLLNLNGCSRSAVPFDPDAQTLQGTIIQIKESTVLLAEDGTDATTGTIYTFSIPQTLQDETGSAIGAEQLKAGQLVAVTYSGAVLESYPPQLGSPTSLRILEQGSDLVGLYVQILKDFWFEDPALNDGVTLIALDLTKVENLSEAEKNALCYVIGNELGMQGILGTFEQLSEQGYIDKENLLFENGVLFTLTAAALQNDSFSFSASKWRSGLGAIGADNCTATCADGVWTYQTGARWIS